jgi:hypothetical protein
MEPRESPVPKRIPIVQAHQLHQHVGDEHAEVLHVAGLVLQGHDLDIRLLGSRSLSGRRRYRCLQDGAGLLGDCRWSSCQTCALARRLPTLRLCILCGRNRLRRYPHVRLWGLRDDGRGGGRPPLCRRNGGCGQGGRVRLCLRPAPVGVGSVGAGVGGRSIGGGQAWRGVLGARIHVASLAALRRRRERRCRRGCCECWLGRGRRVEPPGGGGGHGKAGRMGAGGCRCASRGMVRTVARRVECGVRRRRGGDGGRGSEHVGGACCRIYG